MAKRGAKPGMRYEEDKQYLPRMATYRLDHPLASLRECMRQAGADIDKHAELERRLRYHWERDGEALMQSISERRRHASAPRYNIHELVEHHRRQMRAIMDSPASRQIEQLKRSLASSPMQEMINNMRRQHSSISMVGASVARLIKTTGYRP